MKVKLFFCMLLITGFCLQGQEKKGDISFTTDVVDYGDIEKGADGVRVFEFINSGEAALIITDVKTSCGCTVPEKPNGPIAPGEKGVIRIKYDTNRVGPIRKTVTVFTNGKTEMVAVKLKGRVLDENGG